MSKTKIGDRVYLPHLDQFGKVREVLQGGTISKVQVKNPHGGFEIVETIGVVVEIARLFKGLLPLLRSIVEEVGSWFKSKKKGDDNYPPPMTSEEIAKIVL